MKTRIDFINSFLKLISEIAKNDIQIDSNIVYSNLICLNTQNEDISQYLETWSRSFEKIKNINIIKEKSYLNFSSFKFKGTEKDIKIYIPLDKEHIEKGLTELLTFLSQNNIVHSTKVFNSIRNDNIIVIVNDLFTAEKIRKFVSNNNYIKEGLIKSNPFMFTDKYIAFVWDGYLSYNVVLSEWISDYINELKLCERLDLVSNENFLEYLNRKYISIFEKGEHINEFIGNRKFLNISLELLNYKYITNIIMKVLSTNSVLKEFCDIVKNIRFNEIDKIKNIIIKDKNNIEISIEQREMFDYIYIELSKNIGEDNAIKEFKEFINVLDYRIFTRKNNVRNMLLENKVTPLMIKKIMQEEMKNALINASIETTLKYDIIQLGKALFGIKNDDYSAFTNVNNVRNNLRVMVSKDEIDELLSSILENENKVEDNYWVFIEMIRKKVNEK